MTPTVKLPTWTIDAPFGAVEHKYRQHVLTVEQWDAYRAIWRYSAPRFSDIAGYDLKPVRDINQFLDTIYGA